VLLRASLTKPTWRRLATLLTRAPCIGHKIARMQCSSRSRTQMTTVGVSSLITKAPTTTLYRCLVHIPHISFATTISCHVHFDSIIFHLRRVTFILHAPEDFLTQSKANSLAWRNNPTYSIIAFHVPLLTTHDQSTASLANLYKTKIRLCHFHTNIRSCFIIILINQLQIANGAANGNIML